MTRTPKKRTKTKKQTTMKDIAEAVGVSLMTVSNVVNNKKSAVSTQVRKRVEREIRKRNYRVQASGRNLRRAEQNRVGLIIIDESATYLSHSFAHRVVSGFSNSLSELNYTLVLQGSRMDDYTGSALIRTRCSDAIAALVCGSVKERRKITKLLVSLEQPVLLFQETSPTREDDVCIIRQDDRAGAQTLGEHLIARGCQNLAAVIPRLRWPAYDARVAGLRDAIKVAPNEVRLSIVRSSDSSEFSNSIKESVSKFIETSGMPDAFVCGNDFLAIAVMQYLQSEKIHIPRDVRITGFNAFEVHEIISPRITTIKSPAYEMGYRAAEIIIDRLQNQVFRTREVVFPVSFIAGETT